MVEGGIEGRQGARDGGRGAKERDIEWDKRGIRSLETRVG